MLHFMTIFIQPETSINIHIYNNGKKFVIMSESNYRLKWAFLQDFAKIEF